MRPKDMTVAELKHRATLIARYPQFNSPSDWTELKSYKAELQRREEKMPAIEPQTDFAYRLQKYGY